MTLAELIEELKKLPVEYSNYEVMVVSDIDSDWVGVSGINVTNREIHIA